MTPLLLRRARPIGFAGIARTETEILIDAAGKVAGMGPSLAVPNDAEILDLQGLWLSPGWVDLHTHIYWGGTDISVRPRDVGAAAGVATLVDAGSAGEANFHGFREFVATPAQERIVAFLNLGSIGLVAGNRVSELIDTRSIDIGRTLKCIEANKDIIKGVKIRATGTILGSWGIAPVKIAKKVAKLAGLPIMVHIGEPPPLTEEVFALLGPGDIITHCFHGKPGGNVLEDQDLADWAQRLSDEGVVLDIGHGAASFSYGVGIASIKRGLMPHTISTDLHVRNIGGPVWELSLVMSKMLAIGMTLEQVIGGVTTNALRAVALPHENLLATGAEARFTAFEMADTDLTLPDSMRQPLRLKQRFLPHHTVIGRDVIAAGSRYRDA